MISNDISNLMSCIGTLIGSLVLKCFELKSLKQTPDKFDECLTLDQTFFESQCLEIIHVFDNLESLKYP